ncbi:DUF4097 family beta strand repeat-containing protein [Tenacibaculum sp. M341]|uniref:DUF4097 family beta strand repeat-containing protein n=1 Tax=Tenacibaculum sp. M341 TaxID=2530339 RepID=UPI00105256CD|nr:DUF4097 family beta strand repeat-containing protein [Tenacibaculum sp. M341]TCI93722.1 hypothetical protein EYW44_04715 [Tenacibaculum sp. M341]
MKKIITTALLFLVILINAQSDQFTYKLSGITTVKIETDTKIKITATSGNELSISESETEHKKHHYNEKRSKKLAEKTKGLTAIYPGGKDDANGLGFSIEKEGKTLNIVDLKSHIKRHGLFMSLPKNINVVFKTPNLGAIEVIGLTSEIEASTNVGFIKLKDVTGPITVNANTGNVNVEFTKVNQSSPITIYSNVGEIDVTMPAVTKANLELKTSGTFYTNFEIETPKKDGLKAVRGRQRIESTLNNGGVQIKLRSNLGNIYLRKK